MSVSTCPIAIVNAPIERIWGLLSKPASYALWWDAQTRLIVPEGPAKRVRKSTRRQRHLASSGMSASLLRWLMKSNAKYT